MAGNGQSELLDILSGIETLQKGQMTINDKTISRIKSGIQKKQESLVLPMCLKIGTKEVWCYLFHNYENSILGYHRNDEYSSGFLMDKRKILNL